MTCWMATAFAMRSAPPTPIGVRLTPARGVPPTAQSRPKDDPTEDPVLDKIEADLRRAAQGELERPSRRAWYDSGRKTGISALWAAAYAFVFRYPFIRSTLLGEKQIGSWPRAACGLSASPPSLFAAQAVARYTTARGASLMRGSAYSRRLKQTTATSWSGANESASNGVRSRGWGCGGVGRAEPEGRAAASRRNSQVLKCN